MMRILTACLLAILSLTWANSPAIADELTTDIKHDVTNVDAGKDVKALEHDVAPGAHGSPNIMAFDPTTAIWTIIVFVILLAVLYPTAWKSVLAGLKAREERIRKDIADAEAARSRAEATLKEYNTQLAAAEQSVREMIAKAMADGEKMAATIRMKATEEAEQVRVKATADIEAAKKQAIVEIHSETAELATAIAEKIIRKNLSVDDQRELVRASLAELQKQSNN